MTVSKGAAPRRRGPRFGSRQRPVSKFGNRRTVVDGITFDSAKEARRWQQLGLEERAGHIYDLKRQVPFSITAVAAATGERKAVAKYFADFTYMRIQNDGDHVFVVEDTKGVQTDVFKLKRKLVEHEHGIEISLT
jgi:hypothetical protein